MYHIHSQRVNNAIRNDLRIRTIRILPGFPQSSLQRISFYIRVEEMAAKVALRHFSLEAVKPTTNIFNSLQKPQRSFFLSPHHSLQRTKQDIRKNTCRQIARINDHVQHFLPVSIRCGVRPGRKSKNLFWNSKRTPATALWASSPSCAAAVQSQ